MLCNKLFFIFYMAIFALYFQPFGHAQVIKNRATGNAIEAVFIIIDGTFEPGLANRFQRHVERNHFGGYRVVLNSNGGNLIEGIKLGKLIREYGFNTEIGTVDLSDPYDEPKDGICFSACALAFLGGEVRSIASAEQLGFHQFYTDGNISDAYNLSISEIHAKGISRAQIISGIIVNYMVEMGIDARVFTLASQSSPKDITLLSTSLAKNII